MGQLDNKVAIVTGAGRGWGQAIAIMMAREGAITVAVARTESEINNTVNIIHQEGGIVEGRCIDVSDDMAVLGMIDDLMRKYGHIDVMVNNAAILPLKTFEDLSMEEIDRMLQINLRAPLFFCKQLVDIMKKQGGGSIINVSSNSGVYGYTKESIYCTAKHGIEGFTKAFSEECKSANIAVNTITPGGNSVGMHIKPTSITQAQLDQMSEEEKKQWGDPLLFAKAFVFLGIQRPLEGGITGKRFVAYELSEHVDRCGYEITLSDMENDTEYIGLF